MHPIRNFVRFIGGVAAAALALSATGGASAQGRSRTLFIAGYSVPGEAVQQAIAPAFARKWAAEHGGERIEFQYSWTGSSAQARNVIQGLEADVVYLSDWSDIEKIREAGLITHDWNAGGRGIVSKSVVVLRVPPGNPKSIRDWADATRPGVKVVTPNPRTSGGARWNILALWGSVLKRGGSEADAEAAFRALYRNVVVFDENARASTQSFERGVADVSITYENELLLRRRQGREVEFVIPPSTIYIENPAAVVDAVVEKHGTRDVAEAFVAYLRSAEAQTVLAEFGLRPVEPSVAGRFAARFPTPPQAFDLSFLGGGPAIYGKFFDRGGLWDRVIRSERRAR